MHNPIFFILVSFAFGGVPQFPRSHPANDPSRCLDIRPDCKLLAAVGECQDDYEFMASQCKFTCNLCPRYFVCFNGDKVESKSHCRETLQISDHEAQNMRDYGRRASKANRALRNASQAFHSSKIGLQNPLIEKPAANHMQTRVFDGCDTGPGLFNFFAQLIDVDLERFCGGAAIGPSFVLTVAHCVYEWSKLSPDEARFQIRTGSVEKGRGDYTSWTKIIIHEKYLELTTKMEASKNELERLHYVNERRQYDIALIMVWDSISTANTISLATAHENIGDSGKLFGFGQFNHLKGVSQFPTILQNIVLNIVDDDIDSRDACFFTNDNGGPGDSGGPFVWEENGKQVLGGIYIGMTKMDDGTPRSEFVRVRDYGDWISKTTKTMKDEL